MSTPAAAPPPPAPSSPAPQIPQEALDRLAAAAAGWIGAADAKAAALLGVSNILLGAVFLADLSPDIAASVALRASFILLVMALHVVVACGVLWPRTNREKLLRKAGFPSPLTRSPTYFSDVAGLDYAGYAALLSNEQAQGPDREEQAYILAKIASSKMSAYRWSIRLFVACLLVFCGLSLASGVYAPRERANPAITDPPPAGTVSVLDPGRVAEAPAPVMDGVAVAPPTNSSSTDTESELCPE